MKKLFLMLFFLPFLSYGQFSKGTKYLGGNLTYSNSKTDYTNPHTPSTIILLINGQIGFFVNESWALGPVINYFTVNRPNINPVTNLFEDARISGYAGGLFARKFFNISEKFYFSLEGKGLIGSVNRDVNSSFYEENSTRAYLSVKPAFVFMPSPKWGFDASIGEVFYESNWNANYLENRICISAMTPVAK